MFLRLDIGLLLITLFLAAAAAAFLLITNFYKEKSPENQFAFAFPFLFANLQITKTYSLKF